MSYFTCFKVEMIVDEVIPNEEMRDALWNGMLEKTIAWQKAIKT